MYLKQERISYENQESTRLRLRHRTIVHFKCDNCGQQFTRNRGDVAPKRLTNKYKHYCEKCPSIHLAHAEGLKVRRQRCYEKVGERRMGTEGYNQIYVGPDYPFLPRRKYSSYYWLDEHVYIMKNKLQRRLKSKEVVHHLDGNKTNNTENNLVLLTVQQHNNCHAKAEQVVFDLYRKGLVRFDNITNLYEWCGESFSM
jgi:predicted RNA-binding Zn-ribbon protein involved in translation (DUF1610 family)